MPTQATVLQHPAAARRSSSDDEPSGALWGDSILALVLVAFGSALFIAALLALVLLAPLVAGVLLWLAWRSRAGARPARRRALARRRARALGLVVLAGGPRSAARRATASLLGAATGRRPRGARS